jgi:hypothetical protein
MSETTWCPKCGSNSYRVPGEGDVYLDCGDRLILECNACGTQYHEPESPALLETAPMTDDRAEPHEWLRKTDDELVAKASKIISDMCHGDKWRMCIPVQPDDSDVVLGTLVRRFNELRAATVSAGRLREAAEGLVLRWDGQHGFTPVNSSVRMAVEALRAALSAEEGT